MATESTFPTGQIFVREFENLTEAHVFASAVQSPDRLIDVSLTAGGAWVCVWSPADTTAGEARKPEQKFGVSPIKVETKLLNALLSLGPKPSETTTHIGIIEDESIAEVLKAAAAHIDTPATLLEIRIKRSGAKKGAYAFFALENGELPTPAIAEGAAKPSAKMTVLPLSGDYRRYFL